MKLTIGWFCAYDNCGHIITPNNAERRTLLTSEEAAACEKAMFVAKGRVVKPFFCLNWPVLSMANHSNSNSIPLFYHLII